VEKAPHPLRWLEQDGDAVREDEGLYQWLERSGDSCLLLLQGRGGEIRLRLTREQALSAGALRSILGALRESGAEGNEAGRLILDGVMARRRAIERLCGLGRELDDSAFDEDVWRKTLGQLSLDEVYTQLRTFEIRFDQKYPPQPVSEPEPLHEHAEGSRAETALSIVMD